MGHIQQTTLALAKAPFQLAGAGFVEGSLRVYPSVYSPTAALFVSRREATI